MTADLDLSSEAVERLERGFHGLAEVFDGETRAILVNTAATLRALAAENARLRAEADNQRMRAEEAESENTRAQEQVSAEFEGDCWKVLRALLDRTDFDWPQYGDDRVTADDAYQWIVEELERLEAEHDATWQAGAEAMRESAISAVNATAAPIVGTPYSAGGRVFADAIRALPLPDQSKEGA